MIYMEICNGKSVGKFLAQTVLIYVSVCVYVHVCVFVALLHHAY